MSNGIVVANSFLESIGSKKELPENENSVIIKKVRKRVKSNGLQNRISLR